MDTRKRLSIAVAKIMPVMLATLLVGVLFVPHMAQAAQAPSDVTGVTDLADGATWEKDFTISGGPVLGPQGGTATIKDGFVSNNANNNRKGGVSTSSGSAFIARGESSLAFDNVNIVSSGKPLVFNIWANSSINANNTTLSVQNGTWGENDPFLLIGGYPQGGAGTLNFTGTCYIYNITGAIAGGNNNSVINVNSGSTLTIANSNITLQDGIKFVVKEGATLKFEGCTIPDDGIKVVVESGGTLEFAGTSYTQTTPSIELQSGATFKLSNGAEFTTKPNAGAFVIGDNVTVEADNSDFNVVVNGGVTVAETGTLRVTKSTLTLSGNYGNTTGINNKGTVEIDSSTLVPNNTGVSAITNSGSGTVTISNSTVFGSDKTNVDGAVINSSGGTVTLTDSTFVNNKGRHGGVVYANGGNVTVDGSTFTGNSATNNGGAICVDSATLTLENAPTFEDNTADLGGAIYASEKTEALNIPDGTKFTNNTAGRHGGAIRVLGGEVTVGAATFDNNKAADNCSGGALDLHADKLTVDGATFTNNYGGREGGAIAAYETDTDIKNSTFTGNSCIAKPGTGGRGGAVYVDGNDKGKTLTIDDATTFTSNEAKLGGAVYVEDVNATIGAATFQDNGYQIDETRPEEDEPDVIDGGGLYVNSAQGSTELNLNGTQFYGNKAYGMKWGSGGAAYIQGNNTTANMNGIKVIGNTATMYGGGMTVAHGANVFMRDRNGDPTEFKQNTVFYGYDHAGGGLFINGGYVTLWDAAIYDNYAKDGGAGISTCTKGTAQAKVLDGAAIFNNHVVGTSSFEIDGVEIPAGVDTNFPHKDIENYPDIYMQTKDHKNADTGEIFQPDASFPTYPFELYERMYNGGMHNWKVKPFTDLFEERDPAFDVNSLMAKSNPTNTDVSDAKVVFTQNVATLIGEENTGHTVTGGAIASNGLLTLGVGTEIKIVKVWDDAHNVDGYRPKMDDSFKDSLVVMADGVPIDISEYPITIIDLEGNEVALASNVIDVMDPQKDYNADEDLDAWAVIISGLPKYQEDDETEIKYTIGEKDIEYYTLVELKDDEFPYFELTNEHIPDTQNVAVSKKWDDANNQDGMRPETIIVNLLADGERVDSLVARPDADGNWSVTFKDFPVNKLVDGESTPIEYTISEEAVPGYEMTFTRIDNTKGDDATGEELDNDKIEELDQPIAKPEIAFEMTNKHVPEVTSVEVSKTWDDADDQDAMRPESITVNLLADGEVIDEATIEPDADGNWTVSLTNLTKYKDQGTEIQYRIEEVPVTGYDATITQVKGEDGDPLSFSITNTHKPGTTAVAVEKVWEDENDADSMRPTSVVIHLLADGVDTGQTLVLSEATSWRGSFNGLPELKAGKKIVYTISEDSVVGYTATVTDDGAGNLTLTNTHKPSEKTIDIPVKKVWNDNGNKAKQRPAEIVVRLFANGEDTNTVLVLNESNRWQGSFLQLPEKDAAGKAITYTVKEAAVNRYSSTVEGSAAKGFTVTNTYIEPDVPNTGDPASLAFALPALAGAASLAAARILKRKEQ